MKKATSTSKVGTPERIAFEVRDKNIMEERITQLMAANEVLRKRIQEDEKIVTDLRIASNVKESKKEIENNSLTIALIKMNEIPRDTLARLGAAFDDFKGLAFYNGIRFHSFFMRWDVFYVIQG